MKQEKQEILQIYHIKFHIKWNYDSSWANVFVYKEVGLDDEDKPLFKIEQDLSRTTTNKYLAETYLNGCIKFDGCCELDQGCHHWCDLSEVFAHIDLVRHVYFRAFQIMDMADD